MGWYVIGPPFMNIDNATLGNLDHFNYLSSDITSTISLNADINTRVEKAEGAMYTHCTRECGTTQI